jgi:hypothetical protein
LEPNNLGNRKIYRRIIQLLIEEITCIEQVKKSLYSLYKNRLCPYCNKKKKDFNHIWICEERRMEIELIKETKEKLIGKKINT